MSVLIATASGDAVYLKEHAARPDLDLVAYRVALALAELYLGRLLGKRLVGEDAHPLLPVLPSERAITLRALSIWLERTRAASWP
jgi:hypothetical protein